MGARRQGPLVALALAWLGCSDAPANPAAPEPAPSPAPPVQPAPAPLVEEAADAPCRAELLATLPFTARTRRLTLLRAAAAEAEAPGELALLAESESVELLRLDTSFAVRSRRVLAGRLDAALSTGSGIVGVGRAAAEGAGALEYVAWLLGEGPDDDVRVTLPVPAAAGGALRRNRQGDQVVFTWTDGRRPPQALRFFTGGPARLRFERAYTLGPELQLEDARAMQLLRVTLSDTSFAAILREGAAEAADSQVWLATPAGHVPVETLEDAADIEAMAIVGDQVWAVATFEFSRPLLFRIAPSGDLVDAPVALAPDAALPPELGSGEPARMVLDGDQLLLRRRNLMGDPLLPDARVARRADPTLPADVLREGSRYLVVYQDRDEAGGSWPLHFTSLDCAPR